MKTRLGHFSPRQSRARVAMGRETDGVTIDFTDMSMVVRHAATPANNFEGNPNAKLSYPSPSTKYITKADGTIEGGTTIRTDYSGATPIGVRSENPRTNVLKWSNDFTNAIWLLDNSGATNPIVTASAGTGPDGVAGSATRIQFNKTGGVFSRIQQHPGTGSAGQPQVNSVWMKSYDGVTYGVGTRMGASGQQNNNVTSTWQRFVLPVTLADGNNGLEILLFDSIAGNSETADILVWGAQSESGTFETSYIPTTTAAVARTQDDIKLTTGFPISSSSGTLIVSGYVRPEADSASANYYGSVSDGSVANMVSIAENNGTRYQSLSGGAGQSDMSIGTEPTATQKIVAAHAYQLNNVVGARDGTLGTVDTVATAPVGMTTLRIGNRGDLSNVCALDGNIASFEYYTRRFTAIELEAVTAPSRIKIVCDGNSLSAGTYQSPLIAALGANYSAVDFGVGGQTTASMIADAATQIDPYITDIKGFNTRAALIAWEATNDIFVDNADLATLQSRWNAYFLARAAAGWNKYGNKLVAMTIIARGTFSAAQNTVAANFNAWLRLNYSTYATHLVDLAADSRFQNSADTTYYNPDTIHLNATGYGVVATLIKAAVWP